MHAIIRIKTRQLLKTQQRKRRNRGRKKSAIEAFSKSLRVSHLVVVKLLMGSDLLLRNSRVSCVKIKCDRQIDYCCCCCKMIIAVFLITVLLAFLVQWYFERKKFYKFAENIPSAKNYGILGHGPHFLGKNEEGCEK